MVETMRLLDESGVLGRLHKIVPRDAVEKELALVHDPRYVEAVRRAAEEGGGWVDPDTLITPRSYDVAARVVGGTLAGLDAVLAGEVGSAFCLVRPPGHHAGPNYAMGFCLFNHIAVAAAYARDAHECERVAIVDFDVHHGNGTQDAFYDDPHVLYVSTHQYPFYPGTGAASERGVRAGEGANVNIPMPAYSGDEEHRQAFERVVVPALRRFRPQVVLVSAGFDAHFADEIANQQLSVDGYGTLVSMLIDVADEVADGRLLFALEGGYDLVALPWCVRRTLELLQGDTPARGPLGTVETPPPPRFEDILHEVEELHGLQRL